MQPQSIRNLTATLGFAQLDPRAPELRVLHRWLDTWRGIGDVAAGMHRAGWDLQLTEYGDGQWRATFYVQRTWSQKAGRIEVPKDRP